MDFVASLMLWAGVLGGAAYCFLNHHPKYPGIPPADRTGEAKLTWGGLCEWLWQLAVSVVLGVTAAVVVPVFLHATSSNLMDEVREFGVQLHAAPRTSEPVTALPQAPQPASFRPVKSSAPYVFFGFCVLAAYAAQRFLQAMLNRLLREIEEQKARTRLALRTAQEARRIAAELENNVTVRLAGTLNDQERRILESLARSRDQGAERVTSAGIAINAGIESTIAQAALAGLAGKGLVEVRDHAGQQEWGLTEAGSRWRP